MTSTHKQALAELIDKVSKFDNRQVKVMNFFADFLSDIPAVLRGEGLFYPRRSLLTPRETQILNYIAQGYLNKQIAIELDVSEQTIKNHVTSILRKLSAGSRVEAVITGMKQGLVEVG